MTTLIVASSIDSQMHDNIMAAGSRDRPSMLATGRYPQWRSRFLRYIDTRPNGVALRKCILSGPFKPTTVLVQAVAATDDSPAILEYTTIYKPTSNNLRTSSNSRNKNVDTTPRYKNDNQSGLFRNQRTVNVDGAREKLCKQAEQGVPLQAEKYDWLADTDEEIDEQELEAHYSYMGKIQEVPTADTCTDSEPLEQVQNDAGYNVFANDLKHSEQSESISNTCLVKTDDSNVIPDSPDMCDDAIQNEQNDVESDDERVALANLIANLKLDVDENKKIQNKTLGKSNSVWDCCLVALQNKQTEFEKYKAFNDCTIDYDKLELKLNETLGQLTQKDIEIKEGLKTKAYEISVVKEKHDELIKQSLLTKSHYEGLVKQKTKNVQDRQNRGQGKNARGAGATGYGGAQNRVRNANLGQARQTKCYNCN
nr:hypothetical protein [Tanacetum cinerariifolium]